MPAAAHVILLVEDSEPLGRQMVDALNAARYETTWLRHGDEAMAAEFDRYSLVVLDLMLSDASGFDILARIRRDGVGTPVLIVSSRSDNEDNQRASDLGAIDYLTKPFWPQELIQRVASALRRPGVPAGRRGTTRRC